MDTRHPERDGIFRHAIRAFVWVTLRFLYRVRLEGANNIPKTGAAILTPNHVTFIDAVLIAAHVNRPIRFAMHWRLFKRFRWIVEPLGAFPIASKEENPTIYSEAFFTMDRTLVGGQLVCLFPEGKITLNGKMNPLRNGVLKVATQCGVPVVIVPVGLRGLWGTYFSKAKPGMFKLPVRYMSKISMVVGQPLPATAPLDSIEQAIQVLL